MSQKTEKPSLSGQRLKTRKRDEKEKYDPSAFRDAIIQGLNDTGSDLEQVSKFLDLSGGKLDYRRYADVLFDILFAGGLLAPGGFIVVEQDTTKVSRTHVCVFGQEETRESIKAFFDVFNKLIRRYKYLERSFEDAIKKILLFLKGFQEDEQRKLATILGIILANGFCNAKALSCLFEEHLVKEGSSLRFATVMFKSWLEEKDIGSVLSALKRADLESRLLEFFPVNKRSQEAFVTHFRKEGLEQIATFQDLQQTAEVKRDVQRKLSEMIRDEESPKELVLYLEKQMKKHNLQDLNMVSHIWKTLMDHVEWNKKEELVAEQALKHLTRYSSVLAVVAKKPEAELKLLVRIQEYCYENMAFMKVFQKIIILLYKKEVLTEETILDWYHRKHSSKGKSVFLEQMVKFVEWLENAEEESDEEED